MSKPSKPKKNRSIEMKSSTLKGRSKIILRNKYNIFILNKSTILEEIYFIEQIQYIDKKFNTFNANPKY